MKEDIVIYESNPSLHFFSGISACIVYLLILLLIVGGFHFYNEQIHYGEIDDSADFIEQDMQKKGIELSEIVDEKPSQDPNLLLLPIQPIQTPEPTQTHKPIPIKTPDTTPEPQPKQKEINLEDMFATVSSETTQNRRAKEEAQRQQEIQLRRKQLEEEQKTRAAQLAQNAANLNQSTKALQEATQNLQNNVKQVMTAKIDLEKPKFTGNSQDREKYNKWYTQFETILMQEWKKIGKFHRATVVKVRIRVDSTGKLSYLYMITQSPYGDYNNYAVSFLKNMENKPFPSPPDGNAIDMNLSLESTPTY